jgi:hypothetical protein
MGEVPYIEDSQRQKAPPFDLIDEQLDLRILETVMNH